MNHQEWRRLMQTWWSGETTQSFSPRMRDQLVLATAMLASASVVCLLWDAPGWAQLVLLASAASVLVARSVIPLAAVLVWRWLGELLLEGTTWIALDHLRFADVVSTMALLAFVVFALRYLALPGSARRRAAVASSDQRLPTAAESASTPLQPLGGMAWRLTLAPLLALVLLWLAPLEAMYFNTPRLAPSAYRALIVFWELGLAAVLLASAFSLVAWRRLTSRQASLHVRQTVLDELRRENASIERARSRKVRG